VFKKDEDELGLKPFSQDLREDTMEL